MTSFKDKEDILDKLLIQKALTPYATLAEAMQNELPLMEIKAEIVRNEYLAFLLKRVGDMYKIGNIELPSGFTGSYSEYGKSINDLCIIHKTLYKYAAVISCPNEQLHSEENKWYDRNEDEMYDATCESVECKVRHHAKQQAAKEMKSAVDLLAMALLEGVLVNEILVYGMAINYEDKMANLLKLRLDFQKMNQM